MRKFKRTASIWNINPVVTVTFDHVNTSMLNRSISFFIEWNRFAIETFQMCVRQKQSDFLLASPSSSSTSRKSKSLKTLNCCSDVVSSRVSSRVPSSEETWLGWCSMRSRSPQDEKITWGKQTHDSGVSMESGYAKKASCYGSMTKMPCRT